ncbi:MAG TPA: hypothetical protein VMY42_22530, partial [Thermoguttaceae bacterium]|nr:hypothetical protein [Thermoguttaceae bacterium]
PRIDRLLVPRAPLVEAGWTHGIIGVEGKTSGMKAGRAICQTLDYSRAVFTLDERYVFARVMLEWLFVWPLDDIKGDVASIMVQNRIGHVSINSQGDMVFGTGGTTAIRLGRDGTVFARTMAAGKKAGSR